MVVYSEVWKEVFLVGTEWDQFGDVDKYDWDFDHLDDAINDGELKEGKLYLFGSTEPQLVQTKDAPEGQIIPIPFIVVLKCKLPPPSTVGIKSVQRVEEEIVPMEKMKMGWFPLIPDGMDPLRFTKKKQRVFVLKCEQRRVGLKNLNIDRVKSYEYVLPYIFFPDKQEDVEEDTVVNIMTELEEGAKPMVFEFDHELDDLDDFVDEKMKEEEIDEKFKDRLRDQIKEQVRAHKKKYKQEREDRQKRIDAMSEEEKDSLRDMKIYKFYPQNEEPNVQDLKATTVNRYYLHAHHVF
mmetsp:Transcript_7227/g.22023  ORF Transcript_7227/g.22023 Transcript_7227/m.22023 type:complete len:294 (-) Transcript_7227:79-960(-)